MRLIFRFCLKFGFVLTSPESGNGLVFPAMMVFRRRNLGLGGSKRRHQVESGFRFLFLGNVLHMFVFKGLF